LGFDGTGVYFKFGIRFNWKEGRKVSDKRDIEVIVKEG
jgi:hypothetical protein